jgi:DNA polymerase IV
VRPEPSILHLDLDAFFAAVEQRDKPSLRGKPVVVGGVGQRGVVATASYEARVFGVRSAMPAHEARRRCPHAAFLAGRFGAYRAASEQVMGILRDLSPLVEPLSLDEAFVDLAAARRPVELSRPGLEDLVNVLKSEVARATGGLRASVGIGSSKFIAKVATELAKPDGWYLVEPGAEVDLLLEMPVSTIPGVGPVTTEKLHRVGLRTIADLHRIERSELAQTLGRTHAEALLELAHARDDRPVEPEREAKSISVEDTFEVDLVDQSALQKIIERDARQVSARLRAAQLFARTVTLKIKRHDFSTHTRSRTVSAPTDRPELIFEVARELLGTVEITGGVRLLGVGVAGLTDVLQDRLFDDERGAEPAKDEFDVSDAEPEGPAEAVPGRLSRAWPPGADVRHETYGDGWVWGSGRGRVTVRFETRDTPPGPVRTFAEGDPALSRL